MLLERLSNIMIYLSYYLVVNNMNLDINSKFLKKNVSDGKENILKYFRGLLFRSLITILLFLGCAIFIKTSASNREFIYKYVYTDNIVYNKIKAYYDKYLSGVVPFDNLFKFNDSKMVFNEKLTYLSKNKYLDGVKLKVNTNYLVPIIESGIVVYIGEKEGYGNTIIIQGADFTDIWYGNISNTNVSLYDYVDKGSFLGEANGEEIYLVFSQDGNILNYEKYIS